MFIKVCPDTGFNADAVAHWNYELVPPAEPPVAQSARGRTPAAREDDDKDKIGPERGGSARESVPTPQEEVPVPQPTPTLTLYFVGGGELVLKDTDAEKVQAYFGVPSSYLMVL